MDDEDSSGETSKDLSNSELLASLIRRFDKLATKEDLAFFKAEVKEEVRKEVRQQVQQAKTDLKEEVKKEVLDVLGGSGPRAAGGEGGNRQGGVDPDDPALRQVAFLGFPQSTTAAERLKEMEEFVARFAAGGVPVANKYQGPRNNRTLKKQGYAQFVDTDARDEFLKKAASTTFQCKGATVTLKKGLPHFLRHRDWALGRAQDVLQAGTKDSKVESKRDKKEGTVTVGGVVAFQQLEKDTEGNFVADFSHLSLR